MLKAAKQQEDADDWMKKLKGLQGSGVSYLSAPVGATSYSAAQLG